MMKLSHFFLFVEIIVLLGQLSCGPKEDEKTPSPNIPSPVVAIYASAFMVNLPDNERDLLNGTKYPLHLHAILLPYNCPVSFIIANEGPVGSVLSYSIADNGVLGGFLDYTNGVGSLKSGENATITVTVDPNFTKSGFGGLGWGFGSKKPGSELLLNIYTPDASNFVKNFVIVDIMDYDIEVQKLCGIWTGTWSGESHGPSKTVPVNGTWILNLQSVDWANQTATGTLTWKGSDAWWTRQETGDPNGNNSTPTYYNVDRTLIFNNFNTTLQPQGGGVGNPCECISLYIHGSKAPYSGDWSPVFGGYGPHFFPEFYSDFKSIVIENVNTSGWTTQWYDPSYTIRGYSSGILIGSKSK